MSAKTFDVETVPLEGTQLVEASAGTGKTYAIATLVVRLLIETDWTIDRILVVTFTEAATAELKDRVRKRVRDAYDLARAPVQAKSLTRVPAESLAEAAAELAAQDTTRDTAEDSDLRRIVLGRGQSEALPKLEAALRDFDSAAIFTIHGFCQRALQENSFASGVLFDAELVRDQRPLIEEVVLDFWTREVGPARRIFVEHLRDQNLTPKQLMDLANRVAQNPLLEIVPEGLLEREAVRAGHVFGDLDTSKLRDAIQRARETLRPEEVVRALQESDVLKNKYRIDWVQKWVDATHQALQEERELPRLPEHFDRLCPDAIAAASRSGSVPDHPFFEATAELKQQVELVQTALLPERRLFLAALVRAIRERFPLRKEQLGVVTFDDLLHGLYTALNHDHGTALARNLRERFPAALIDEFQDTDPLQYAIFNGVFGNRGNPLFLIGDPKQAIYSFRGADVFAYLQAATAIDEGRRYTMRTNYRSDAPLVDAVNELFCRAVHPFFLEELSFVSVGARPNAEPAPEFPEALGRAPLQFRFLEQPGKNASYAFDRHLTTHTIPELVAKEVVQLLQSAVLVNGKRISPKDVAVLTRTNAQAFDCQAALQRHRVPSVVLGDRSVFEYTEATELQLFLGAVLQPQNQRAMRAALLTQMLGVTVSGLLEMESQGELWDRWADRFRLYNQRWGAEGFVQMIRLALAECGVPERLLHLVDGERRMTNLLHLVELLHLEAKSRHLGPTGLFQHLAEMRSRSYAQQDSEQIRLESDEDTVTLTTIHKSKGLEYPVVICPYLFKDFLVLNSDKLGIRYHDRKRPSVLTMDLGSDEYEENLSQMEDEALAENLRLLYVALTRAKHRTVIFWCGVQGVEVSALAYVLHGKDARSLLGDANRELVSGHIKTLDDTALRARLNELQSTVAGVEVRDADPDEPVPSYLPSRVETTSLRARSVDRRVQHWQRTASFTELSHNTGHSLGANEGRDHDERQASRSAVATARERCLLADFPGGARAGNFFHSVLEEADFQKPISDELLSAKLRSHGFPDELKGLAGTALSRILKTRLGTEDSDGPNLDVALANIDGRHRLNELEFHLALGAQPTHGTGSRAASSLPSKETSFDTVSPATLARVFSEHQSARVPRAYADALGALRFLPLRGFLKGFVDLVFQHGGKWFVVDYKSNNLGDHYEDYGYEAMTRSMVQSHYFLQYHLYAVAFHLLLGKRKRNYDYDADFGGVFYLFLRGMKPGKTTGVFYEKPPRSRIEALAKSLTHEVRR